MLISDITKVPLYPEGVTPVILTVEPLTKPERLVRKYVAAPTFGKLGVILTREGDGTTGVITPAVVKVALV
jgi:hypothetical protein